ncbi:MAG: HAD family hydrolase [Actinomycetales bacterium]|jgi:hydroxymethylpyrimidine pyrophosphatase-like HAD family hydrolase|nr:HAD family hydrolase [Candidatus Phosphoribacter baldrii]MBK6955419.1 HAD family hydrolase [Candidatus Phosphoribacter baldrii]MBK7610702.1 HAD family hydrolase [Candidatus Phosphoribacter baldrii]HRC11539.1 HAD family hydrolase [Dermatophilaceae bacterium]
MPSARLPGQAPRPRLVATDLDGTLLRPDGALSARTRRAVLALDAQGIAFVVVTARPPRWLHELVELTGSAGVAVCGNGAFVYDVAARAVLEVHGIPDGLLADLVGEVRAAVPGVRFGLERASGAFLEPGFPRADGDGPAAAAVVAPLEDRGSDPVGKLLAVAPHWSERDFLSRVASVVGDRANLAYSGAHGLAEITGPGVTKATGLARWAATLGVGAESVWAFGDMPNDLPMLRWAGRSYAVANAHPDVLTAATHRCPANSDDGVATVLESLAR